MASITQRGPNSFRVLIRQTGQKALCKTFKTKREAIQFVKKTEQSIAAGVAVNTSTTVLKCIAAFRELREARRPIGRQSNEEYMLRHLAAGLGPLRVDQLTPKRVAEYCRERSEDGAGPYTIGMEMSKLGTVLRHASIWMHQSLPDVVGQARELLTYSGLIGPGKARERVMTDDEIEALSKYLCPVMQDIVRFAVASAMRRGEICRIAWDDVDEKRKLVLVRDRKHPRKKAGNNQLVPLIGDAWEILSRQPRTDARIFPVTPEWISDQFLTACRLAGIEDLHFHDTRHTATTRLFESGLSIQQVAIVTGHQNWQHLRRYTHITPDSLTRDTGPGTLQRPGSLPT